MYYKTNVVAFKTMSNNNVVRKLMLLMAVNHCRLDFSFMLIFLSQLNGSNGFMIQRIFEPLKQWLIDIKWQAIQGNIAEWLLRVGIIMERNSLLCTVAHE